MADYKLVTDSSTGLTYYKPIPRIPRYINREPGHGIDMQRLHNLMFDDPTNLDYLMSDYPQAQYNLYKSIELDGYFINDHIFLDNDTIIITMMRFAHPLKKEPKLTKKEKTTLLVRSYNFRENIINWTSFITVGSHFSASDSCLKITDDKLILALYHIGILTINKDNGDMKHIIDQSTHESIFVRYPKNMVIANNNIIVIYYGKEPEFGAPSVRAKLAMIDLEGNILHVSDEIGCIPSIYVNPNQQDRIFYNSKVGICEWLYKEGRSVVIHKSTLKTQYDIIGKFGDDFYTIERVKPFQMTINFNITDLPTLYKFHGLSENIVVATSDDSLFIYDVDTKKILGKIDVEHRCTHLDVYNDIIMTSTYNNIKIYEPIKMTKPSR